MGRGGSLVRRSEAVDIGLEKVAYSAALVDGNLGLDLQPDFFVKEGVAEVSIGHALIADALEFGLAETVRRYLVECSAPS